VGWIRVLLVEMVVAVGMLNERHNSLPQNPYDHNTLGQVGQHNAATVCLPARATGCGVYNGVSQLDVLNFSTLRVELMVGHQWRSAERRE
jgi:hypothetical protein